MSALVLVNLSTFMGANNLHNCINLFLKTRVNLL
jgi:hypothetical protein